MPLNPPLLISTMTASLQLQLQTQFPEVLGDPTSAANQIKMATAIATAVSTDVLTHIQANGLVNTVVAGVDTLTGAPITGTGVGVML